MHGQYSLSEKEALKKIHTTSIHRQFSWFLLMGMSWREGKLSTTARWLCSGNMGHTELNEASGRWRASRCLILTCLTLLLDVTSLESGVWSCKGRLRTHPSIFRELLSKLLPPCLGAFHPLTIVSWQRWKILRVPEQILMWKNYGWKREKKRERKQDSKL